MNYSNLVRRMFFLFFVSAVSIEAAESGPLTTLNKKPDQLLTLFSTAPNQVIQNLINKYVNYSGKNTNKVSLGSESFSTIVQEVALLYEAFFAHLGLLMNASFAAGIDLSNSQTIDPSIPLQSGLDSIENQTSTSKSVTIPEFCGTFFNICRYIRGLGGVLPSGVETIKTTPIDNFYGAVVLNLGWYGSTTEPANFNTQNGDKQIGNTYWIRSGINVTSLGENKTFILPQSAGVARVQGGIDSYKASNGDRVLSLVLTDKDGVAAFSSTSKPAQIAVSGQSNIGITLINTDGTETTISLNASAQSFLQSSFATPWAVLVVSSNSTTNKVINHVPTFKVVGLVRLNPNDFPLYYEAPSAKFISQPFTTRILTQGVAIFQEQIRATSIYSKSTVIQNISFGACKDMSFDLTLSTSDTSGMYAQPVNMAIAKLQGALNYQWGTKYTIENALEGATKKLSSMFLNKEDLSGSNLLTQINGKKMVNKKVTAVKRDPNIFIIGS